MAKRILLVCSVIIAVGLIGGIVSLIGNPVTGDTWIHRFPNGSGLYLASHQQSPSFRVDHTSNAGGVTFGRCSYVWGRH